MHKPSTMLCSRAYSTGSAGRARLMASATESDFQYATKDVPTAMTSAMTTPTKPNCSSAFSTTATSTASSTKPAISSAERLLLEVTWSYRVSGPGSKERREDYCGAWPVAGG